MNSEYMSDAIAGDLDKIFHGFLPIAIQFELSTFHTQTSEPYGMNVGSHYTLGGEEASYNFMPFFKPSEDIAGFNIQFKKGEFELHVDFCYQLSAMQAPKINQIRAVYDRNKELSKDESIWLVSHAFLCQRIQSEIIETKLKLLGYAHANG